MKRVGHLFESVVALENLHEAARRALRGKRSRPEACAFFVDLEANLLDLRRGLRDRSYKPGAYRTFRIRDPKPRLISAAPFRDRVVHHAIVQVIEPHFERRFIHHSYACRVGRGSHAALGQFVTWARRSGTVLKLDIKKYFPSIDHAILKRTVSRVIKDQDLVDLIDLIVDRSNAQEPVLDFFPGDDLFTPMSRRVGLPIGNLTSQFFANVYLDALDHFVTDRLRAGRYLRYMDDFIICDSDKGRLADHRAAIREFLFALRLRLNEGKSRIRRLKEGVEFLGFVVLPDRLRVNQRGVRRQRRRMRALRLAYAVGEMPWTDVSASLTAWDAHARHGKTWRLRRDVYRRGFTRSPG